MPDCSKRASRPSSSSRNMRSASRPCSQTGSRCTDRQKFCCLSSAEIEGRINRLQEKMRQYNRELRDKVAEISTGDGPMNLVLLTVVEMTTKYELPFEEISGMANGIINGLSGLANGVTNGGANGMANGVANRMANGIFNGIENDMVNEMADDMINEIPNDINERARGVAGDIDNGMSYGFGNEMANGIGNGMINDVANGMPNERADGIANGMANGVANGPVNGMDLGDQELSALIASALNRFRDQLIPDDERPRY